MNSDISPTDDDLIQEDMASLAARLEQNNFFLLSSLSEEQIVTLFVRLSRDRDDLLGFIGLIDRLEKWNKTFPAGTEIGEGLRRFLQIAPILRRDAIVAVK